VSANPPPPVPRTPFGRTPWPAVVTDRPAQLLQLQQQFAQSQWWPNEILKQHQLKQAAKVLAHAYETVPFYRPRLDEAGYRPGQALDWNSGAAFRR